MGYEYHGTGEDRGPEAVRPVTAKLVPSSVKTPGTGVGRRKSPPGGGKPAPLGASRPDPRPVPEPLPEVLTAGGFRWSDPPAARGRDPLYLMEAIAALKKRPGRWAQVIAGRKTRPDGRAYRRHGLETQTRREEGAETFGLWARWTGK